MNAALNFQFFIPSHARFEALALSMSADGRPSFEMAPIAAVCEASGMDSGALANGPPAVLPMLLDGWLSLQAYAGEISGRELAISRFIVDAMKAQATEATPCGEFHLQVRRQPRPVAH